MHEPCGSCARTGRQHGIFNVATPPQTLRGAIDLECTTVDLLLGCLSEVLV